jgi:phage terminase large subunit GpA-like protein
MALVESSPGEPLKDPNWKPARRTRRRPLSGILGIYNRSDRRRWYWRCPHCNDRFEAAPGLSLFNLPPEDQLAARDSRTRHRQDGATTSASASCARTARLHDLRWSEKAS